MHRYAFVAGLVLSVGIMVMGLWGGMNPPVSADTYGNGMGASTLAFEPQSLTVQQGKSASAKVTVKLASGKTWGTDLGASDVPEGLSVSFTPSSGDPTFVSTMSVKAAAAVKAGAYTIRVRATGDDPSPVTSYRITVTQTSGY